MILPELFMMVMVSWMGILLELGKRLISVELGFLQQWLKADGSRELDASRLFTTVPVVFPNSDRRMESFGPQQYHDSRYLRSFFVQSDAVQDDR